MCPLFPVFHPCTEVKGVDCPGPDDPSRDVGLGRKWALRRTRPLVPKIRPSRPLDVWSRCHVSPPSTPLTPGSSPPLGEPAPPREAGPVRPRK